MTVPPLTPIYLEGQTTPLDDSSEQYPLPLQRRTSSFSAHSGSSPVSPKRHRHRFSNVSQISDDFHDEQGTKGGLGNLADELDQLDDEDYDDDTQNITQDDIPEERAIPIIRDSGVDVSYGGAKGIHNTTASVSTTDAQEYGDEDLDRISAQLDDAIDDLVRVAKTGAVREEEEEPLFARTMGLLQDLGNQANLEAATRRLTTSTNSLSSHLATQSRELQSYVTSLLSSLAFTMSYDTVIDDATIESIDTLLRDLPTPDSRALHGIQKLDQDNTAVTQILSQLTDTLQIGKHATTSAARYLRSTQTAVVELRRERERADAARQDLQDSRFEDEIRARRCAQECRSVLTGFESFCESIEKDLCESSL